MKLLFMKNENSRNERRIEQEEINKGMKQERNNKNE